MSTLCSPFHETPLRAETREDIVDNLWQKLPSSRLAQHDCDLDAYFMYYTRQCVQALHDRGRHISARSHKDLIDIAQCLEKLASKDDIKHTLRPTLSSPKPTDEEEELLEGSINLAARVLLMIDLGVLQLGFSGRSPLVWNRGSIREFVHSYFKQPPVLGHDNIKLEKSFTARNLGRIGGIEIMWTDNLADHLRMVDDDDRKVAIFHYASSLNRQHSQIFPEGLVEETIDTLALMFPCSDKATEIWFNKLLRSPTNPMKLDRAVIKCGQLKAEKRQIENFKFWHDRLVILKQAFDQSRPATVKQWWLDRRNGVQWYTFWVAILILFLTIIFGLIQSIEGALQVYKAYHPTAI